MELSRRIPAMDAAAHAGVHIHTFRRHYGHLIKRIGKRRDFVSLYDLLTLPPPPDTS
jgi:hypothetical protein